MGMNFSILNILGHNNYRKLEESYVNSVFHLVYDSITIGFHSSSIFIGVGMAFCRIMSLTFSNRNRYV